MNFSYQVEKAWNLYTEAQSKGIVVDTDTINSLIRVVNFARENSDLRWKLVEVIKFVICGYLIGVFCIKLQTFRTS